MPVPRPAARRPLPRGVRSPVLLLGAGAGEATCGILYLASFLRRHGIEASVRLFDDDVTDDEVAASVAGLLAHVRPKLVGISLKWFHHVARARSMARAVRAVDPSVEIALGGNSATYWSTELLAWDCVDSVVLGDGEVPLLALCRGDAAPPNVVTRSHPTARLGYVQGVSSSEVYYSHFDELFLSQLDLASFSGWVAPGKGCAENCLYCGGTRGMQKGTFGRAKPFLRPEASVLRDHQEIAPKTWQLRYDFSGSSAAFLERSWAGVDLSKHSTTYFLWGVPPPGLMATLSQAFARVFMVLDIGCFSETQRLEQINRGLLKPCPTNRELFEVIAAAKRYPNLELEISGIAGLPFASRATLREERQLVEQVLGHGCAMGYQRLESQPGALVTEHPARFEMVSEASTFAQFLDYFDRLDPAAGTVPMVRFADRSLEAAVHETAAELDALIRDHAARRHHVELEPQTRLVNAAVSTQQLELGAWLGSYRVPPRVAGEPVTVIRSVDGTGLACAPSVTPRRFHDATLQQGEAGAALLSVLEAFATPTTVARAISQLEKQRALDSDSSLEVIEHLTAGRFLQPR